MEIVRIRRNEGRAIMRADFGREVLSELDRAYAKHGDESWSRYEFYGIIAEEFEEMWDCIKRDAPTEALMDEVIQVAAMCLRFIETGGE